MDLLVELITMDKILANANVYIYNFLWLLFNSVNDMDHNICLLSYRNDGSEPSINFRQFMRTLALFRPSKSNEKSQIVEEIREQKLNCTNIFAYIIIIDNIHIDKFY